MNISEITGEFIQLNQFLKKENIASSGGEARVMIENGMVMVNGSIAHEIRKKLRNGDVVRIQDAGEYTIKSK